VNVPALQRVTTDLRLGRWQDVLADVADASVRLVLTSPPYDNARTYEQGVEPVDFDALGCFARRVLMPGGVLAMVIDGACNDGEVSTTPYRIICEWAACDGWHLSQVLAYGRSGAPGAYSGRFRRDHEPLLVFHRDGGPIVCNKDAVASAAAYKINPSRSSTMTVRRRHGGFEVGGFAQRDSFRAIKHRGSIWFYGSVGHGHDPSADTGHPATFAECFALDAVRVWSNPGDLVCDPFSGSGTVARACIDTQRSFVGAESEPAYHARALQRLAQLGLPGSEP
jgi:hypothetical protein